MLKKKFEGALGSDGNDYIAYTVSASLRLQQLVKDLLAYTQASAPASDAPPVAEANAAVQEALTNLRASIEETGAHVEHAHLPDVRVHRTQLVQLFQNLIGNAIKYRADRAPRIVIGARPDFGGRWIFSVRDNGIGIDARYQEQIFGIFKRLHAACEYSGTGIGLAICRRIVERHGGAIWVESTLGQGATFLFILPGSASDLPGPVSNRSGPL
jgi:light-regulated signal transduction histidine kinase (bacteriophytochrome)